MQKVIIYLLEKCQKYTKLEFTKPGLNQGYGIGKLKGLAYV